MNPIKALQLIDDNLGRLSGSRKDHMILQQAVEVIRAVVLKSGNVPPVAPAPEAKDAEPVPSPD